MTVMTFDIGGTFIKYGVFDEHGQLSHKGKTKTDSSTPENFYRSLAHLVATQAPDAEGIGISIPGFIDTHKQQAVRAGALEVLDGQYVGQELSRYLDRPCPIWLENDANCAAMAEKLSGGAQDVHDFIVVTLGTGIGGGIFINDRILRGASYQAGEFGMMLTDYTGQPHATLHDLASTRALVESFAKAYGVAPSEVSGEEIFERQDEPKAQQVLSTWADHVAVTIFNLVTTLNPQRVLLGGGVSRNSALIPLIQQALSKNEIWSDFVTDIQPCQYFNDAGLYGAYYAYISELKGEH